MIVPCNLSPAMCASEWKPETYHELSDPQFAWSDSVLNRIPSLATERVIDLGCGTGRVTSKLLQKLPTAVVIANDKSPEMLSQAKRFLSGFGDRVSFLAADMSQLPFQQYFDGVFSSAAFHWVPDHDRLFRSIFTALRNGGWLEGQCGGEGNLRRLQTRVGKISKKASTRGQQTFVHYESAQSTMQRLSDAGFSDVHAWLEPSPAVFKDESAYRRFVSEIYLRSVLPELTEAARNKLAEDLGEISRKDEVPFSLDYVRLNISAKKLA
jgi:trans-aconitate 2-methyltransferase